MNVWIKWVRRLCCTIVRELLLECFWKNMFLKIVKRFVYEVQDVRYLFKRSQFIHRGSLVYFYIFYFHCNVFVPFYFNVSFKLSKSKAFYSVLHNFEQFTNISQHHPHFFPSDAFQWCKLNDKNSIKICSFSFRFCHSQRHIKHLKDTEWSLIVDHFSKALLGIFLAYWM